MRKRKADAGDQQDFRDELLESFQKLDSYKLRQSPRDGIEERILKNVLLELIVNRRFSGKS